METAIGKILSSFIEWLIQNKVKMDKVMIFTDCQMWDSEHNQGWVAEMAPDPIWLGSFVRCALEHPELFQYRCPECGEVVYPYRCAGSPLSGRVDLEGSCRCGWRGDECVSGWRQRAILLRDQMAADRGRYRWQMFIHSGAGSASVRELLDWLGEG